MQLAVLSTVIIIIIIIIIILIIIIIIIIIIIWIVGLAPWGNSWFRSISNLFESSKSILNAMKTDRDRIPVHF